MKFYRAIRYVHASKDGRRTLCGQLVRPTHVNSWLWTEVDSIDAVLRPCPKCKPRYTKISEKGSQTRLVPQSAYIEPCDCGSSTCVVCNPGWEDEGWEEEFEEPFAL